MRQEWLDLCLDYSRRPADFYSGCRKILRGRSVTFETWEDDLAIADCGFTKSKLTMLRKGYLHEESRDKAVELWAGRVEKGRYGSVGFHCYNHLVKGGDIDTKRSKRASVMGPCIQAVTLTLSDKGKTSIDIFYRTTELFKKFPADLVFLRDELLAPFDLNNAPLETINFYFANVTCHPMYFVTVLPMLEDPVAELDRIKDGDQRFFDWTVKWTARYICPEHHRGIAKFAQALRVQKDAYERLDEKTLEVLRQYFTDNHPGYRNNYQEDEEDED